MADAETTYEYGQRRSILLRKNKKTHALEIFRPKTDTWEEYKWDGARETWYDCTDVSHDHVDSLKASLRELEESMNPAPPVYEFDTSPSNLYWGRIWASVQFDSDREIWNVSAGIEGCRLGVIVAEGFDEEPHAENYAEDFEAGRVCIVDPTPAREWLRMIGLADMAKKFDTDVREHLEFMARKWLITPDGDRVGLFEVGNIYKRGERISREPNVLTREVAEQFLKDSDWEP